MLSEVQLYMSISCQPDSRVIWAFSDDDKPFYLTWAEGSGGAYSIGRLRRPSVRPSSVHNFKLLWNY